MGSQLSGLRRVVFSLLLMGSATSPRQSHSQTSERTAQELYRTSEQSVFLINVNDTNGKPLAFGSGFLVSPRRIITNEHVIEGGTPVLAIGPVRLPLRILRVDHLNDLALLEVDTELTSAPLPIQGASGTPGETVFAIGNPEGLEKSLSQGIISGLRTRGQRELLQITSPISHGSSGGPILNSKGEVVGVAVGMLVDGQNLNFAVPAKFINELLKEQNVTVSKPTSVTADIVELDATMAKHNAEKYSGDDSSEYQRQLVRAKSLLNAITDQSVNDALLRRVACRATADYTLSDAGLAAVRKAVGVKDSSENRALLAFILYDRATDESVRYAYAKKDSPEEQQASVAQAGYLSQAAHEAERVVGQGKGPNLAIGKYVLGSVRHDQNDWSSSLSLLAAFVQSPSSLCESDLVANSYKNLIEDADKLKRTDEAEKWFRQYAAHYTPTASEWDSEGDRRANAGDAHIATEAYEKAAEESYYGYDNCYAAWQGYIDPQGDKDRVIRDGRACVEASTHSNEYNKKFFDEELPRVYHSMAAILESRGVYDQALQYVKESLNLRPSASGTLNLAGLIYEDLQRYSECISIVQQAIRASDGKFPYMQFQLGNCYFDSENWSQAATSFKLAADGDRTDVSAAYNLALSLQREGFVVDSRQWAMEALKRSPNPELKTKIESLLNRLQ